MNALEVLEEKTPRSAATIAFWREHVAKSARRLANQIIVAIAAVIAVTLIVVGALQLSTEGHLDIGDSATLVAMCALWCFLVPAPLVRYVLMRDAKKAARLARDGVAHRGSIVRRIVGPGLIPQVVVAWREGERRVGARFQLTNAVALTDPDEIVVLARLKREPVVAIFGDEMGVGSRTRLRKEEEIS